MCAVYCSRNKHKTLHLLCKETIDFYDESYTKETHNTVFHLYCVGKRVAAYAENYAKNTTLCVSLVLYRKTVTVYAENYAKDTTPYFTCTV